MSPTIKAGDIVLARLVTQSTPLMPNDIVVCRVGKQMMIKRIISHEGQQTFRLAGDHITSMAAIDLGAVPRHAIKARAILAIGNLSLRWL